MKQSFSAFALFLLLLLVFEQTFGSSFPPWNDRAKISVYYLEVPLLGDSNLRSVTEALNLFHVGIGFLNEETGEKRTADYTALNFPKSFFPTIVNDSELSWVNAGFNRDKIGWDHTNWTKITKVMEIDGDIFNRFQCWTPLYNQTNAYYKLLSVWNLPAFGPSASSWPDIENNKKAQEQQNFDPVVKSSVCIDFAWRGLQALWHFGGKFTAAGDDFRMKRDLVSLMTNVSITQPFKDPQNPQTFDQNFDQIRILDVKNNAADRNQTLEFYRKFNDLKNKTMDTWVPSVVQILNGKYILYHPEIDKYYEVPLRKPFIVVNYTDIAVIPEPMRLEGRNPKAVQLSPTEPFCERYFRNPSSANTLNSNLILILGLFFAILFLNF